jgi:hypothetical protein
MKTPLHTLPVGTQVVVRPQKTGTDGSCVPAESVGVITAVEMGKPVRYHVRLSDGTRVHALREELTIRTHFQVENLAQFQAGYLQAFNLMDRIIYRCVVGSRAYGLAVDDSDTDRRGIYLAPVDLVFSLGKPPEQIENPDLEFCYWELEKFILLALKANPNILECLYTPLVEFKTDLAEALLSQREMFLSKMVYQTYNGYVLSQFRKIEADLRNHDGVRWKHAMHLIRLLISGRQVLEDGFVPLRLDNDRDLLLAIREGQRSWEEVNDLRLTLHRQFEAAYQATQLPNQPDYAAANQFLIEARRSMQHDA